MRITIFWGLEFLVHITLGRKKDPFFLNIRNPIPQKVKRIPNIDPELGFACFGRLPHRRSNGGKAEPMLGPSSQYIRYGLESRVWV